MYSFNKDILSIGKINKFRRFKAELEDVLDFKELSVSLIEMS